MFGITRRIPSFGYEAGICATDDCTSIKPQLHDFGCRLFVFEQLISFSLLFRCTLIIMPLGRVLLKPCPIRRLYCHFRPICLGQGKYSLRPVCKIFSAHWETGICLLYYARQNKLQTSFCRLP